MNLYLNDYYNCREENIIVSQQKINCKYWNINENICTTACSLNIVSNPTPKDCNLCTKRDFVLTEITIKKESIKKETEKKSFIEKAKSYAKAEISQIIEGKVSEDIFCKRKNLCLSCEFLVNPKPNEESIGWCKGGCGCQIGNTRSALSAKLYMPHLKCPKNKFDVEKGNGFDTKHVIESLNGIKNSIIETAINKTE